MGLTAGRSVGRILDRDRSSRGIRGGGQERSARDPKRRRSVSRWTFGERDVAVTAYFAHPTVFAGSEASVHDVETNTAERRVFESLRNGPDDVKSKRLPKSHSDVV